MTAIALFVIGFVSLLLSIGLGEPSSPWFAAAGYVLIALGLFVAVLRWRRHRQYSSELSGSDAYSDLELGRRPPTHFSHERATTSQIGDPPPLPHAEDDRT